MWTELVNSFFEELAGKILKWFVFIALIMAGIGGGIIYLIMK